MNRKIVATGVLLTGLLVAMPVLGQADLAQAGQRAHVWTSDRPDGHAPAGVKSDFLLPFPHLYFGYRYSAEKFSGTLIGTEPISGDEVLGISTFTSAPLTHDRWTGEVDLRLGLTNFLTVAGSVPWTRNTMLNVTATGLYETTSEFLGDVSIRGLFDLLDMEQYRLSLTLGGTVPTGKISEMGTTPTGTQGVLPYTMQGGSGTPDILIGGTFQVQNEVASVGAQINSVTRVVDNTWGYRLGNEFDFTVWGAYNVTDWVSFSLRTVFQHQGRVDGDESRTDGLADPLANPFAQGGERVLIPFGMNLYLREGRMAGHRLSIEFYYPVHEDLNGPQMSVDRNLLVSWQVVF